VAKWLKSWIPEGLVVILLLATPWLVVGSSGFIAPPPVSAASATGLTQVPGNTLSFLPRASYIGPADQNVLTWVTVNMAINSSAAQHEVDVLSDLGSASFHQWLAPLQFEAMFGPTQSSVTDIRSWITNSGLQASTSSAGNSFGFQASIGAVEKMFSIDVNTYTFGGLRFFANSQNPSVPASFANGIVSIDGLNNYTSFSRQTQIVGGNITIVPADVLSYYDVNNLLSNGGNAAGQKIVLIGQPEDGINLPDVTTFWNTYSIPWSFLGEYSVEGGVPGVHDCSTCGSEELSLDAEWAGVTGQQANISAVTDNAPSWEFKSQLTQWFDEINYAINTINPTVISFSVLEDNYTLQASDISNLHNLMVQAVAQGITVVSGTGDYGFNGILPGLPGAFFPTEDPNALAVGGLTDTLNGDTPGIIGEKGWSFNDIYWAPSGAGGGSSLNFFTQPAYQSSETVTAPNNGVRDTPDISFPASPDIVDYFEGNWVQDAGTSYATPMFGGVVADIAAMTHQRQGLFNVPLYAFGYSTLWGYAGLVDITNGNNGMSAGTGWDYVTGLGRPDIWNLARDTANYERASTSISAVLSSSSISVGGSVHDSATLAGLKVPYSGGTVTYEFFSGSTCSGGSTTVSTVTVTSGIVPDSASRVFNSAGSYSWNAVYSGDTNNFGSTSACEPLSVGKLSPTISASLSATTITVGGSVYDRSTLSGATSNAGGTVTYKYYSGGSCSGSGTIVSTVTVTNGVVPNSASHLFGSTGSYSWNAVYSGDANNNGATSSCQVLTVNKASPSLSITLHPGTNEPVGTSVYASASQSNGYSVTGTVTYYWYSAGSCSGTASSQQVTISSGSIPNSNSQTYSTAGTYSWKAVYSGDSNNNGATSNCVNLIIYTTATLTMAATGPAGTTLTPSAGIHTYALGTRVTISATGNKFCYWTGTGAGSYSGTTNQVTITVNNNVGETAYMVLSIQGCPNGPQSPSPAPLSTTAILSLVNMLAFFPDQSGATKAKGRIRRFWQPSYGSELEVHHVQPHRHVRGAQLTAETLTTTESRVG